jgi:hypothetical protein
MSRILAIVAVFVFLCVACASPASATTIYTYTGKPFTTCSGVYAVPGTSTCNGTYFVSGSFTVANPLANGLVEDHITGSVLAMSFTDNGPIGALTNPFFIQTLAVWTNGAGTIVNWTDIILADTIHLPGVCGTPLAHPCEIDTINAPSTNFICSFAPYSCPLDRATFDDFGTNTTTPGTWSRMDVTTTPEPSSILLLGAGLLAVSRRAIRHKQCR